MVYNRYIKGFSLALAVLFILMFLLVYLLLVQHLYLSSTVVGIVIVFLIIHIIRKTEAANKKLNLFFQRVNSDETSINFPRKNEGAGFDELTTELNKLSKKINSLEESKRRDQEIYKAIVQNLKVGVFILDAEHQVFFSNPVAQNFLNIRTNADYQKLSIRAPHFIQHLDELRLKNRINMEVYFKGEKQRWQIQRNILLQNERKYELFLVNNLQADMENKESEVIEKLMHTLTHEIMNSISPLTSLSETLQLQLSGYDENAERICMDKENFNDIKTSARIIGKRGLGLIEFVERYALLARLPRLKMERISGEELLEELNILLREDLSKAGIHLKTIIENRNIYFRADKQLLLQVLINLIKNAREAYDNNSDVEINVMMSKSDGYNYISVTDKAGGIPEDIRKNIFLPFFTTKNKGSGIGLSLSRKIILAHQGRLYFRTLENGSEFRIEFMD